MMDRLEPCNTRYLTAAGKPERPMGMLFRVPITMGQLTIEIDAMVTNANSYNVLIGNDWLQMASADILLSSGTIRVRTGRDAYEDIPIETNIGVPRINALETAGTSSHSACQPSHAELLRNAACSRAGVQALSDLLKGCNTEDHCEVRSAMRLALGALESMTQYPQHAWYDQNQDTAEIWNMLDDLAEGLPRSDPVQELIDWDDYSSIATLPGLSDDDPDAEELGSEGGNSMPQADTEQDAQVAHFEQPSSLPDLLFDDDLEDDLDDLDEQEDSIPVYWPAEKTWEKHTAENIVQQETTPCEIGFDSRIAYHQERDSSDWKFDEELFESYSLLHGPFSVDACADYNGYNAQCLKYWCEADSCLNHSWAGEKVWCNPPFLTSKIIPMLEHAISGYHKSPDNTRALFVLPDWPDAKFWTILKNSGVCRCVGYYPAGETLFTAPPANGGAGKRRIMAPTTWGVVMVLVGKPTHGGSIPWSPWPPVAPPTVVKSQAVHKQLADEELPALSEDLTLAQKAAVQKLLDRYASVFSSAGSTGRTNIVTHSIDTGSAIPFKQPTHRLSADERQVQREEVQKMLQAGVITHSNSPWASPVVLVGKKDGTKRFCVDYRGLNDITRKDVYPLPRTEEVLDELGNAQWFSKLDLKSGYWQIVVDPADRSKTAFTTRDGLYEFVVMPFGLTSAPATFQRLMDTVLQGLLWEKCMVYLDDIIVYSKTWEEHIVALDQVFSRLRAAGLQASGAKCALAQTELLYLGHLVTREGILPDNSNIEHIAAATAPKNVKEVRSFLGMANYYSQFVEGFAEIARPLYRLTKTYLFSGRMSMS